MWRNCDHFALTRKTPSVCLVAPHVWPILAGGESAQKFVGGAEVQQTFIACGLRDAGYPVTVLSHDYGQPDDTNAGGIRFIKIQNKGSSPPAIRYFHPRLTGLWSAIQRADADIYYQRCAAANTFVAGLFCRLHRRHFVFAAACDFDLDRPRTREIFRGRGGWRDLQLYRLGLRMASAVISQHAGQTEKFRRYYHEEAVSIPSTYSLPATDQQRTGRVVLWVSVLRRAKRPELFLDLARSMPQLRFRMIGGVGVSRDAHAYYAQIEAQAKAIPNVEFLGFLPYGEADRNFDDALLFVNTSDYEGFPNTFLQAWARGIPTVSFVDCNAQDSHGPVGLVARDLTAMRDIVTRLAGDESARTLHGTRSRQYFLANHSLPAVIQRYGALFDRLIAVS